MGRTAGIEPGHLTASGEQCLRRVTELSASGGPAQQLVTSIATAVEVHLSSVLDRLIRTSVVAGERLGGALLAKVGDDIQRTWDSRADWLKEGFGLQVKEDASYGDFSLVVDVRNAVVHGAGRLTDYQMRSIERTVALRRDLDRRLDIDAHSELRFGPSSLAKITEAVRKYVLFFDRHLLKSYPGLYRTVEVSSH